MKIELTIGLSPERGFLEYVPERIIIVSPHNPRWPFLRDLERNLKALEHIIRVVILEVQRGY